MLTYSGSHLNRADARFGSNPVKAESGCLLVEIWSLLFFHDQINWVSL